MEKNQILGQNKIDIPLILGIVICVEIVQVPTGDVFCIFDK